MSAPVPAPDGGPPERIVIADVSPTVEGGRFPVKRVVGEPVDVAATIFADGHERLWCVVEETDATATAPTLTPMVPADAGLDRWSGRFVPTSTGSARFRILAWIDVVATWADATHRKLADGQDVTSELLAGAALLTDVAAATPAAPRSAVDAAIDALRAGETKPVLDLVADLDGPSPAPAGLLALARQALDVGALGEPATSAPVELVVEPEAALFNTWYELFPRSWSATPGEHGTFADVEARLSYVADMGFDVLYLPPIHPIGRSFRKGRDNTTEAGPDDPGSPWAIGSATGGHTAIHPRLGSLDDFRQLVRAAGENDLAVALDIAFQCSPDHPWVTQYPDWFAHRPDGSIQYAENPPKKYQDIYPLHFGSADWKSLWEALLDVFLFWADEGIGIFRVDNPHTKPFAFWEWLIAEVQARHPHTVFLSEAFTRPAVMHRLAMVGFTLSYSYFPWRHSKQDLTEYFTELASPPGVDYFRPSCWPNTPDILTTQLWGAPRELFALRYFLAGTLSPSVGIYGPAFELCENRDAHNGKEEYADSEKYEIRDWDRNDPISIRETIEEVNRIRFDQLALHTLRTIRFHPVENDALLAFSKCAHSGPSVDPRAPHAASVLVVANLDPHSRQSGMVDVDLGAIGVDPSRPYIVHDLYADRSFEWFGSRNYVELEPAQQPGHIFKVTQG